jgi:hypothetical protein
MRSGEQIGEGPACYILVKSGWKDMYHLIFEDPEQGDYHSEFHFMNRQEIEAKYPFVKFPEEE